MVSFILVAACGALCQNALPDAPSKQTATQEQSSTCLSWKHAHLRKVARWASTRSQCHRGGFAPFNEAVSSQTDSNTIMGKYLHPPASKRRLSYHTSSSGSVMGRATYAASRIFVTRDDSGKSRLNTSYLLRTLTSVAAATASRPYWRRPLGAAFQRFWCDRQATTRG